MKRLKISAFLFTALAVGAAAGWFAGGGLGNGKAPVEIAGITAGRKYDIMLPVKN